MCRQSVPSKHILNQLQVLNDIDVGAILDVVCGVPAEPSMLMVSEAWDYFRPVASPNCL